MKISVSILSTPYSDKEAIEKLNETDADFLHVDVIDGHFVKGVKREFEDLHLSEKKLDIHLMVSNPFNFITKYAFNKTETITISREIGDDIDSLLNYIKSLGIKCGIAIKPSTPIRDIEDFLPKLDKVLLLTVEPGASGQKMLTGSLYKLDELKSLRDKEGYHYEIWVDGGVNKETIKNVSDADGVVANSHVTTSDNFQERIDELRL